MAKLTTTLMIYDPSARTERTRQVTIEGPEFLLDCLERDASCLDMQMLVDRYSGKWHSKIGARGGASPHLCMIGARQTSQLKGSE